MTLATATARRASSGLDRIVAENAVRGAAVHVWMRGLLVVFVAATVLWEPPEFYAPACRWLAAGYVLWAVGIAVWWRVDPDHLVRLTWLVLTADLLLFGVLNQLTGISDVLSWTPYILVNGFLLIPLLAAAQLRPLLGVMIGIGTTVLYLVSSIAAQQADTVVPEDVEPWSSVVMRTFVVAAVSVAAVLLSRVQRRRVSEIAQLAAQRADLLGQLGSQEDRQRRELAEALHDGALQYLLGARLELDEARDTGSDDAFDRIDEALTLSTQLLRSTVSELHPAVLAQAGLTQAIRDLAVNTAGRSRLQIDVTVESALPSSPGSERDDVRDPSDLVLYSATRELLNNVVKHAAAQHVSIIIRRSSDQVTVTVTDDGRGIAEGELARQLAAGHIGVASHRLRVEAAGGELTLAPAAPHGTVATVTVPLLEPARLTA